MEYIKFREKIGLLLANRMEDREASLLRDHIATCRVCQMILEDVRTSLVSPIGEREGALSGVEVAIDGYRITGRIGKGGMGEVFRGVQLSLNRDVALKVLAKRFCQNEALIQRFEREARAAGRLSHPNLIRVYDFGKAGDTYFFSMEFIDGKTVSQLIKERGRLDVRESLEIALKVAIALEYAHREGLIHRDIKPDNIMLTAGGEVKVADMGLVKEVGGVSVSIGGITVAGEKLGTPYYMSPEQVKETKAADHRADIYSLGATLFHMLTGRRPFTGKTAVEVMQNVISGEAEFTEEEEHFIPAPVRRLLMDMLEKNINLRVRNWKQVIRSIESLLRAGLRGPTKK
jgi:serine/threonine-protein kinase